MISPQVSNHYVLVFNLTSRQNDTETCHYAEPVVDTLKLELNLNSPPLKHVAEVIVLGIRTSAVAVDKLGVAGKKSKTEKVFVFSKESIVSRSSTIGTLVHFPVTMSQFFAMRLLLFETRTAARCSVRIG